MVYEVHPDEPAEAMFCGPKLVLGAPTPHWLEQIIVYRDDELACYERDFGPAEDLGYLPPMIVPSLGCETVGSLMDMAEYHRHDQRWAKRMAELKQASNFWEVALRSEQQRVEVVHNRSQFGPYGHSQRNGWSSETAWRRFKDRRAKETGRVQL